MLRKNKGFTLIELLVVIAIIAILAAILFPVFMQAKEQGRRAACISNMKQMGAACMAYTDDFAGTLPLYNRIDSNPVGYKYWWTLIWPYVRSGKTQTDQYAPTPGKKTVFACPNQQGPWDVGYHVNVMHATSHSWLSWTGHINSGADKLARHKSPSKEMWLTESERLDNAPYDATAYCPYETPYAGGTSPHEVFGTWGTKAPRHRPKCIGSDASLLGVYLYVAPRHNGGANVTFLDGHVNWLKAERFTGKPEDAILYGHY